MVQVTMTDRQKVPVGVSLVDVDGQAIGSLPPGVTVSFVSSNPAVASVVVRPDGLNADIGSGQIGTATITVHVDGLAQPIPDDTVEVTVINSEPGSLNLTVGAPEQE